MGSCWEGDWEAYVEARGASVTRLWMIASPFTVSLSVVVVTVRKGGGGVWGSLGLSAIVSAIVVWVSV